MGVQTENDFQKPKIGTLIPGSTTYVQNWNQNQDNSNLFFHNHNPPSSSQFSHKSKELANTGFGHHKLFSEDLAKFWQQIRYQVQLFNHHSIFLATY
jgi:hypothetical protein